MNICQLLLQTCKFAKVLPFQFLFSKVGSCECIDSCIRPIWSGQGDDPADGSWPSAEARNRAFLDNQSASAG